MLLRVPSRPSADFLWPGVGDLLVSERVRTLWEREGFTGAVFSRAECDRAIVPAFGSTRPIVFEPRMWRGEDASLLPTTLYVIVTDRARRALEQVRATTLGTDSQ